MSDGLIRFQVVKETLGLRVSLTGPPGAPGPAGPAGADGNGNAAVSQTFQYNQVSPISFPLTVPAGKLICECRIFIETPFDGQGALVSIGTSEDHSAFCQTTQCDPTQVGCYTVAPFVRVSVDTQVLLYLTPGVDAHQGSGKFFVYYEG